MDLCLIGLKCLFKRSSDGESLMNGESVMDDDSIMDLVWWKFNGIKKIMDSSGFCS